jgi:hypothetical protein
MQPLRAAVRVTSRPYECRRLGASASAVANGQRPPAVEEKTAAVAAGALLVRGREMLGRRPVDPGSSVTFDHVR